MPIQSSPYHAPQVGARAFAQTRLYASFREGRLPEARRGAERWHRNAAGVGPWSQVACATPLGSGITQQEVAISSGAWHTCALAADGAAVCWGSDDYGQALPLGE